MKEYERGLGLIKLKAHCNRAGLMNIALLREIVFYEPYVKSRN